MSYEFDHVHLKSPDPKTTADWYVNAFDFEILSDNVRTFGDRFIRCATSDGIFVNISSERTNEKLGDGDANAHWGLEHIGIKVTDIENEIRRLETLGAELKEGPIDLDDGRRIAFLKIPVDVRVELLEYPS